MHLRTSHHATEGENVEKEFIHTNEVDSTITTENEGGEEENEMREYFPNEEDFRVNSQEDSFNDELS